jgi:DNA repair photolyase
MIRQISGFRRLLMSADIVGSDHASYILKLARRASIDVHYEPENNVDRHEWSSQSGTLIVKTRPETGWLSRAEHGSLAVRKGEYYLHPIVGCRSGCTYCYLLGRPHGRTPLRLHLGIDELIAAIEDRVYSAVGQTLLFCTGELADSLADAQLWPVAALLAERFSRGDLGLLELRTKSDLVNSLLTVPHNGFTTVGFSIAPEEHIVRHEPATASLQQRLRAASTLSRVGYRIAFKCEPIIPDSGWERAYQQMFMALAQLVPARDIDHVSVGCLRWSAALASHPTFARKYGESVSEGAQIQYRPYQFNGTLPLQQRLHIYRAIREMILSVGITAPIWWSLEEPNLIKQLA